jgi:hypothetical protein
VLTSQDRALFPGVLNRPEMYSGADDEGLILWAFFRYLRRSHPFRFAEIRASARGSRREAYRCTIYEPDDARRPYACGEGEGPHLAVLACLKEFQTRIKSEGGTL